MDIWDEALWYLCNPSLGKHLTLRALRLEAQAAKKSEAAEKLFRWLRLNQWISVKAVGWLPLTLYDKTQWNRPEWQGAAGAGAAAGGAGVPEGETVLRRAGPVHQHRPDGLCAALPAPGGAGDLGGSCSGPGGRRTGRWRRSSGTTCPYRDWARAGFLELCPGDMVDFTDGGGDRGRVRRRSSSLDTLGVDPYLTPHPDASG